MKILKALLKVFILLITTVWGIVFGIITPLVIMNTDVNEFAYAGHFAFKLWLVMGIVGIVVPCFLMMLDFGKLAVAFSVAGTVIALVLHMSLDGIMTSERTILYLPQIFMTILTAVLALMLNWEKIGKKLDEREAKAHAKAQSVFEKRSD